MEVSLSRAGPGGVLLKPHYVTTFFFVLQESDPGGRKKDKKEGKSMRKSSTPNRNDPETSLPSTSKETKNPATSKAVESKRTKDSPSEKEIRKERSGKSEVCRKRVQIEALFHRVHRAFFSLRFILQP